MKIYSLGYMDFSPAEILKISKHLDAHVIDVRFRAWSRKMEYCGNRLSETFGERYIQIQKWGNVNYQNRTLPFRISDFFGGLDEFNAVKGNKLIMCTCHEYLRCHRSVLIGRLGAFGYDEHICIHKMSDILQPALL